MLEVCASKIGDIILSVLESKWRIPIAIYVAICYTNQKGNPL